MTYWLNGDFRENPAGIDFADRGFLLGDGVFETILLADGEPAFLTAHLDRLRGGAAALGIAMLIADGEVRRVIRNLVRNNGAASGLASARLTLTRGVGPRGLAAPKDAFAPTLLITLAPYAQAKPAGPAQLIVSAHARNERSLSARWKTLNYLDNILARQEAADAGADDAVMLNLSGRVACASAANIFLIREGKVTTPPLQEGAMPGIVRGVVIGEGRKQGLVIDEAPVEETDLLASTLFLTNSLTGLRPAKMAGAAAVDENGGDIFKTLETCYQAAMKADIDQQKATR